LNLFRGRTVVLMLAFFLLCSGMAYANKLSTENGSSRLIAKLVVDGEEELILDGFFRFKYPLDFQIQYLTSQSHVYIFEL